MELSLRLTAAADLPGTDATLPGAALVVPVVAAVLFLLVGLANYAGYGRFIATAYIVSPYVFLALAWLGAGALLVLAGAWLLTLGPLLWDVVGVLLAVVGVLSWVVGIVGLFWLPVRLRPRWMRELMAGDTAGEDVRGEVWR